MTARQATRERVVRAALLTLANEGFRATSARAIARTGGFAAGVIYYHFEDLDDLLLAALDHTTELRLERYRQQLLGVTSAAELVRRLRALYAEDIAEGHVAAVQELIGGAAASPRLGPAIVERLRPWRELAEEVAQRFLAGTPLAAVTPAREAAFAALALYLGVETLSHLDGDRSRAEALFAAAERAAAVLDLLEGGARI